MTPLDIITKFVTRQLNLIQVDEPVTKFELFHASGDAAERLQIFPIITGETKASELAAEILEVAETDVSTRKSSQPERYGVIALLENNPEPVGQTSFMFEARKAAFDMTFEDSEPPNTKGHTGQMMRQNETMHKLVIQMSQSTAGSLLAENQRLREEIQKYRDREDESRRVYDAAMDLKDEREISTYRQKQRINREDQLGGMLLTLAPSIIGQFLGKKGLGEIAGAAEAVALKQFITELDEKEITGVFTALKPPHQMALMELYKTLKASNEKEEAKSEKPALLKLASGE